MVKKYDVIIVGGGPAGIFAALELVQASGLNILLVEKGRDIDGRQCAARDRNSHCITCDPCNLVCGLGGAGAFSDGKLTLSADVGGRLAAEPHGAAVAAQGTVAARQRVLAPFSRGKPERPAARGPEPACGTEERWTS